MADNKQKLGEPDRSRININEPYELTDWSKKFGVSTNELRKAVEAAGTYAEAVELYLQKNKATDKQN